MSDTHFKYLGTSIEEEGGMETEIAKRVGAGWMNWKKCSGVLCDKRMPVKLKGKVYRTVVRPAMLYGAETWATTKRQESRIEVNEMRMMRWMCGVTRKDKIRNEHMYYTRNDESRYPEKKARPGGVFFFRGVLLVSYDLQLSHFVG